MEIGLFKFFSAAKDDNTAASFSEDEARDLIWAKALEEKALKSQDADNSAFREITSQTAHELGEGASYSKFLDVRAGHVIEFIKTKIGKAANEPKLIPFRPFFWGLAVVMFVGGVLTNEFSVTGNKINLLYPPLLGVILWNIFIYCVLFANFLLNRGKKPFMGIGIRRALGSLLQKIQTRGAGHDSALSAFYQEWLVMQGPLLKTRVAEMFHFAAFAFGLGLIASIGIHGWGTEYTVGWESTWLADKPAFVAAVIKLFYGLVPFNSELFSSLTPEAAALMNFSAGRGVNASPWLLQMFYVLSAVVLIPRVLLTIYSSLKAGFLRKHFSINLESSYYSNILRQWKGKTMLIQVIPFSYPLNVSVKQGIEHLAQSLHPENSKIVFSEAAHEDTKLPDLGGAEQTEALAVFAMTSTPEAEVQGKFIQELKKKSQAASAFMRIIVDTSGFEARFANTPQRIRERKKNWSDFLDKYGVSFAFVNLTNADINEAAKQFEQI